MWLSHTIWQLQKVMLCHLPKLSAAAFGLCFQHKREWQNWRSSRSQFDHLQNSFYFSRFRCRIADLMSPFPCKYRPLTHSHSISVNCRPHRLPNVFHCPTARRISKCHRFNRRSTETFRTKNRNWMRKTNWPQPTITETFTSICVSNESFSNVIKQIFDFRKHD
jgi:hypothetical protein